MERTFITGAAPDHRAFRPLAAMSKDITPLIHTISGAATKHSARLLLAEMTTKDTAFQGKPSAAATNHLALPFSRDNCQDTARMDKSPVDQQGVASPRSA